MRITQEADYAIRICCVLDEAGGKLGAAEIAARAGAPYKFVFKILRKLMQAEIVRSFVGSNGGYQLNADGERLTAVEIIESIDGPMCLSKCMDGEYTCTRNPVKAHCKMHIAFCAVSKMVRERLNHITVRMLTDRSVSTTDVAELMSKFN